MMNAVKFQDKHSKPCKFDVEGSYEVAGSQRVAALYYD